MEYVDHKCLKYQLKYNRKKTPELIMLFVLYGKIFLVVSALTYMH